MSNPTTNSNYFKRLPDHLAGEIFSYLTPQNPSIGSGCDARTIVAAAAVCKAWRSNSILQEAILPRRVHFEMIERDYPPNLLQLFKSCATPIDRLPLFEYPGNIASGLINMDGNRMAQPLMRVKGRDGVPGILFHLQGRRRPEVIFRGRIPLQSVRSVLLLFKKNAAMWGFGGSFHFPTNTFTIIQDLHKEYYKQGQGQGESCPICPLTKIDEFIGNLLTGQDPLFLLSGSEEPAPLAPVEIRVERGSCLIL